MSKRKRVIITKATRLKWLLENPKVWEGFPKEFDTPGHKSHERQIFEAMQQAKLFSAQTNAADVNLEKLISMARFVRRMGQQQPKPENN